MSTLSVFFFSGTGNTRYVAEKLCEKLSGKYRAEIYDVTSIQAPQAKIAQADLILLAFPVYGSAPPIPMREFIHKIGKRFSGKKIIIAETQYFFSGDGAASVGRTVERYGGKVIGAEHFNMPNNLADCKIFPVKNANELQRTLTKANKRIDAFAKRILGGKDVRRGFHILPHAVGYYCQRKYWRKGEKEKRNRLKINADRCIGCGLCAKSCPADNITVLRGKAEPLGRCVICYRCVNLCPQRAITLIGSAPPQKQYKGPNL